MAQHARITKVMSAWTIVPTFKSWTAGWFHYFWRGETKKKVSTDENNERDVGVSGNGTTKEWGKWKLLHFPHCLELLATPGKTKMITVTFFYKMSTSPRPTFLPCQPNIFTRITVISALWLSLR
jgi:hypothetical protein